MYTKIHSITMQRNTAAEREIKLACFLKIQVIKIKADLFIFLKKALSALPEIIPHKEDVSAHILQWEWELNVLKP